MLGQLDALTREPSIKTFIKRRHELAHRLTEHELVSLSGFRRLFDHHHEDDEIETQLDRDRWDLLAESMDVDVYRNRLRGQLEALTDVLDELEAGLCRELINGLSRRGLLKV